MKAGATYHLTASGTYSTSPLEFHLVRGRASPAMMRLDLLQRPMLVEWSMLYVHQSLVPVLGPSRRIARLRPWWERPRACLEAACRRSHMRWIDRRRYHYVNEENGFTFV